MLVKKKLRANLFRSVLRLLEAGAKPLALLSAAIQGLGLHRTARPGKAKKTFPVHGSGKVRCHF